MTGLVLAMLDALEGVRKRLVVDKKECRVAMMPERMTVCTMKENVGVSLEGKRTQESMAPACTS